MNDLELKISNYKEVREKISDIANRWLKIYRANKGVVATKATINDNDICFYAQMTTSGVGYWNPEYLTISIKYLFDDSKLEADAKELTDQETAKFAARQKTAEEKVREFEDTQTFKDYAYNKNFSLAQKNSQDTFNRPGLCQFLGCNH